MKLKRITPFFLLTMVVPAMAGCRQIEDNGVRVIGHQAVNPVIKKANSNLPDLGEPSIQVHYHRDDALYDKWGLWLWAENKDGAEYTFNYSDGFGGIAYYPLSTFGESTTIGFVVKELFSSAGQGVWNKDGEGDRFIDLDMLIPDEKESYHIYIQSGKFTVYTNEECTERMNSVSICQFSNSQEIEIRTNNETSSIAILKNGHILSDPSTTTYDEQNKFYRTTFTLSEKADVADIFRAQVTFKEGGLQCEKTVSIRKLYDEAFGEKYNYDGELGALYTKESTTFKVWSPVSSSIELRIYNNGTPMAVNPLIGDDNYVSYDMVKDNKGVFSYTLAGDLEGKYYTYFVINSSNPEGKEVVDPYAKSAGVSGLRGMVVDFDKTNPTGWGDVNYLTYDRKALTVYETHIAELTCSETWGGTPANAKKYDGFYEPNTTYTKGGVTVKTGFDHIKELGVNAVQIIPFFDQANDETNMEFNWGYNPLNYNVLEGGYSSNPHDGYARIKEFKKLVKAYNDAGITIIMDVVYNHVNGLVGSNFDVLMPFYYFRYNDNTGSASNGSGCGNETASDKYMFRKFMIDSTKFWASEYKLGGFRFDLMGIHDIETMNQLTAANKTINPNIVIYGEPWAGGTTALPSGVQAAVQANARLFEGYGAFNDHIRDSLIAGGMAPTYGRRWVTQTKYTVDPDSVVKGMKGITGVSTSDPNKAVTYVTCHDNYTLHDRLIAADLANDEIDIEDYKTEAEIKKMNALANSIIFTSQGTSFMLAGEEMLRTKIIYDENGNPEPAVNARKEVLNIPAISGNSYNASYKTNEINYEWKINNLDLFATYQKLVELKQKAPGLHATEPNEIEKLYDGKIIKVTFAGENGKTYIAYHRNGVGGQATKNTNVSIVSALMLGLTGCSGQTPATEDQVNIKGYSVYLDTLGRQFTEDVVTLQPFETLIIAK